MRSVRQKKKMHYVTCDRFTGLGPGQPQATTTIGHTHTKIKTNFPYQHTLLNIPNDGGLNCASDGI